MIEIPELPKRDLYHWLVKNKSTLVAAKKFEMKRADPFSYSAPSFSAITSKAATPSEDKNELDVVSVINTTYWYDSHGDVHIDGLWKKTLQETKSIYLLQEHKMEFDKIISDEVTASTKKIAWKTLGVDFPGYTEALVFESRLTKDRNPYMFEQYRLGRVKNHSVGMRYVDIELAINDDSYPEYKSRWDEHIDYIANRDTVEEAGYFWPVKQAKCVEGSAVPIGSNIITPTRSVKNIEPPSGTQPHAAKRTRVKQELNNLLKILQQ